MAKEIKHRITIFFVSTNNYTYYRHYGFKKLSSPHSHIASVAVKLFCLDGAAAVTINLCPASFFRYSYCYSVLVCIFIVYTIYIYLYSQI